MSSLLWGSETLAKTVVQPVVEIVENVYAVPLGMVNAFILSTADGVTLIDTGTPGSAPKILDAVRAIGKQPADVHHILVTHLHADHTGGLAALKHDTGAPAYMHPIDAALIRQGITQRKPIKAAPGLMPHLLAAVFSIVPLPKTEAATIEHEVHDGETLPIAGGIQVIQTPGHSAGQVAFLWPQHGGVLFAGDAAATRGGKLNLGMVFEDIPLAEQSARHLSDFQFEAARFGHGEAITHGACKQFAMFR